MKCFLFPIESTEKDKSCTFVLKDINEIRISVPIKISANNDCNKTISFSNSDLETLAKEISAAFSSNTIEKSTEIKTLNDFILNQNKDLQNYINHVNDIPTLDDCLRSKNFIFKTEQDLESLHKTPSTASEQESLNILLNKSLVFDLDFIKQFTKEFKQFRQNLGVTQMEVGQSMKYYLKSDFSQTTICRFESMTLASTNMFELIPYFRKWISKVYNPDRTKTIKNVISKLESIDISRALEDEFAKDKTDSESSNNSNGDEMVNVKSKTRKQRIQFTRFQLKKMESLFQTVKHTQITPHVYKKYAKELKLNEKQIRCWFTKRRRSDRMHKNKMKMEKFNL